MSVMSTILQISRIDVFSKIVSIDVYVVTFWIAFYNQEELMTIRKVSSYLICYDCTGTDITARRFSSLQRKMRAPRDVNVPNKAIVQKTKAI